jgi:hypothetical protein
MRLSKIYCSLESAWGFVIPCDRLKQQRLAEEALRSLSERFSALINGSPLTETAERHSLSRAANTEIGPKDQSTTPKIQPWPLSDESL